MICAHSNKKLPFRSRTGKSAVFTVLLIALLILGFQSINAEIIKIPSEDKETDPAALSKLQDFQDLKFGLFIHWGPCSQWGARIAWPPRQITVSTIQPAEGAEVTLIGKNIPLKWEKNGKGTVIHIPDKISHRLRGDFPYCRHAWTIKISQAIVSSEL